MEDPNGQLEQEGTASYDDEWGPVLNQILADALAEAEAERNTTRVLALDAAGLARTLSLSTRQVWRLHSAGRLPAPVRLGRALRWPVVEIEAWLAAGAPPRETWQKTRTAPTSGNPDDPRKKPDAIQ